MRRPSGTSRPAGLISVAWGELVPTRNPRHRRDNAKTGTRRAGVCLECCEHTKYRFCLSLCIYVCAAWSNALTHTAVANNALQFTAIYWGSFNGAAAHSPCLTHPFAAVRYCSSRMCASADGCVPLHDCILLLFIISKAHLIHSLSIATARCK